MKKVLTVTNIVQAARGAVQLSELDKDKKPIQGGDVVALSFSDPARAAEYKHGKKYNVEVKEAT